MLEHYWSLAEDSMLIALKKRGLTFADISKTMNKAFDKRYFTRNACIGRWHRIKSRIK